MLSYIDIFAGLICLLLLSWLCRLMIRKEAPLTKSTYRSAFRFRMFCVVAYALITAFYYRGGDTEMFLYATRDMQAAFKAGDMGLLELASIESTEEGDLLYYYFDLDDTKYPVSGFMRHSGNFMVPKLGLVPYMIFFNSYLALCMVFSFFAFTGSIRLHKLFLHYFPKMPREVALAVLFLPSACYWSSGFLKDSICFGSMGYFLYGLFQIFIRKRKILASVIWLVISSYFLYTIKVYILLALIPGAALWIFGATTAQIKQRSMRRVAVFLSLIVAAAGALYFLNYLTSSESLAKFSMDNILESSDRSRGIFERRGDEGSNFQINTSNPVLLILNGLVATFFRPFPWEISSAIVAFSAIESIAFLSLFLFLLFKAGVGKVIQSIFSSPLLLLCFSFAVIFAISVGISTTNFGSLSRYKIPCLPFYLMFILGAYHLTRTTYPGWMNKILNFIFPKFHSHVRNSRISTSAT